MRRGELRRVVTGSDDGVAKVWAFDETQAPTCEATLFSDPDGHAGGITSVSYSPKGSGDLVATSSKDNTIKIWRPSDPQKLLQATCPPRQASEKTQGLAARGHTDFVNSVQWCPEGQQKGRVLLSCSDDRTTALWDAKSGRRIATLECGDMGHSDVVSMATYSKDGNRVLTGSHDMTCVIWDPRKTQEEQMCLRKIPSKGSKTRHTKAIWSARFSADTTGVATASKDTTCIVWSTSTGQDVCKLEGHTDFVIDCVWNEVKREQVLSCSMDGTARVWDVRQPGCVKTYDQHTNCVWSATYGHEPTTILTCSHDMTAMVFDQRMGLPRQILAGHNGILWQASLSPDDLWAVTCSEDGTARVWDLSTGELQPKSFELLDAKARRQIDYPVTCASFRTRAIDPE